MPLTCAYFFAALFLLEIIDLAARKYHSRFEIRKCGMRFICSACGFVLYIYVLNCNLRLGILDYELVSDGYVVVIRRIIKDERNDAAVYEV